MSASSGEINSLATVTVVDITGGTLPRGRDHTTGGIRLGHAVLGIYAVTFAGWAAARSLVVAVHVVGSLFYGSLLGCFVLALGLPAGWAGKRTFIGMLAAKWPSSRLSCSRDVVPWYNVIGCVW